MMLKAQRCQTSISLVVLMVLALTHCQENERRAVTEHQLMHDRGRSIQSLKRLIWLSSAIEGLHTAHTRTLTATADQQQPADSSIHRGALELLLSDMYRPYLAANTGDGDK
ncbi:parathyroid hormone 4 [Astyanax mexicanus]|uniref:Parathyroid hormone-like hormone b n=2 Tax=Astyanax mexicanus TaxID=7994 RepID=A0A3B1J070_ASTMX|nr:parathyroid hormone 4 [Astyanax mexicanus]KAG9260733.1 parathyroid hormone-like [Astyanax mexicanus]